MTFLEHWNFQPIDSEYNALQTEVASFEVTEQKIALTCSPQSLRVAGSQSNGRGGANGPFKIF